MAQDPGAAGALSAQLKYLTDAAHLMAFSAPGSSSHLMSRCNLLMFSNDINQSDSHRRHVCGGCGNIMTPGWTSTVKNEVQRPPRSRQTRKRKASAITQAAERSMVYTCDRCKRETRQVITTTALPRIASRRAEQSNLTSGEAPERLTSASESQAATPTTPSANASSRKRAKSRKQGGLQALLAKNKEASQNSSSGFGLDLMDLMNNG
ncbi:hypothetical protein V499_05028 [Pseudogymnoascus sp. VKM F-103]|uniref:Uncharacterized protein n=1 Tax=Pseudogymnoascus verrucosus TaxID=342668 RepID=A0A1B8GEK2_9PEZI|nr:uncharacterized protein VE01_07841 [Pseudogymnoascus verrucosus]KFY75009.1 hypothetical protein V499_05028 [Pseudogymnoascus sp. VKM F-103]OBT94262.1 hypothetical protein VE01_07841 [Pseudogymnoascus verrucosus]